MAIDWTQNTDFYTPGFKRIYFACFIAFLNSAINGYDLSLFGGLQVLQSFRDAFNGGIPLENDPNFLAIMISILQIGSVLGCFFVGYICDTLGRKGGMIVGSLIIIAGTILELATNNATVFMAGRFLVGFGVVFVTTAGPTYTVEIAHPHFRGRVGAIYNTGWHVGAIPAAVLTFGMTFIADKPIAWQLPVGMQAFFSGMVLIGNFFIPESPRWMMAKGREEEARKFLVHFHGNDKEDHPIVEFTLNEMKIALEDEKLKNQASYFAFFQSRAMLY
ncbi:hypothetical protein HDV05_004680, partial [Chytridiales sp. JEL 0842]